MHCWRKQSLICTDEKSQVLSLMIKAAVWREILLGVLQVQRDFRQTPRNNYLSPSMISWPRVVLII